MGSTSEAWSEIALEVFLAEAKTLSGLVGVSIENWVVLQRNKFDIYTKNEPHIAQMLYMERASGRYLHKIFGKTIQDGQLDTPSGLKNLTQEIFEHSKVCEGVDDDVKVEPDIILAPGFQPYPRKVGPNCQMVFKDPNGQATMCPNCTQGMQWDMEPLTGDVSDFVETKLGEIDSKDYLDDFPHVEEVNDRPLQPRRSLAKRKRNTIKEEESDYHSEDEDDDDEEDEDDDVDEEDNVQDEDLFVPKRRIKLEEHSDSISRRKDKVKGVHCDHCNKTFSREQNYRKHLALLRRHERNIPCKECAKSHYSFDSLGKHMAKNHDSVPIAFNRYLQTPKEIKAMKKGQKCSTCYIYFNGHIMVHRHRALYHELGNFQCTDCNQYLLTYYHLVLHNYNKHNRVTPYLEPSADDLDKVDHEDGTIELSKQQHVCPKCNKIFKYDADWGIHMKIHHSWSVFTCPQCDEMCHYASDFTAHVMNFHSANPEIKCPKCSDVISLKEDPDCFDAHFRGCVSKVWKRDDTPFQCEKCGKNYSTRYLLQCHLKSHEGVERFLCDKCDYGTNLKKVMQDHQKAHLRAEGMTQDGTGSNLFYHCDQCPKKFSRSLTLNRHIKHIHEGVKRELKCKNCDATFNSSSMLYIHKRRVHGFVSTMSRRGRRVH